MTKEGLAVDQYYRLKPDAQLFVNHNRGLWIEEEIDRSRTVRDGQVYVAGSLDTRTPVKIIDLVPDRPDAIRVRGLQRTGYGGGMQEPLISLRLFAAAFERDNEFTEPFRCPHCQRVILLPPGTELPQEGETGH